LESLDISDTPVADATVLGTCPALNTLYCSENTSTAGLPDRIDVVVY
jgi:Leucine-rich repeat (LRR) protein